MSRYELQKLYRKICKKSPEVYGNEDLWMENMADADSEFGIFLGRVEPSCSYEQFLETIALSVKCYCRGREGSRPT